MDTHNTSRPMPEFDVLMSPAVDQLTTDPLVELNGITCVLICRVIINVHGYVLSAYLYVGVFIANM